MTKRSRTQKVRVRSATKNSNGEDLAKKFDTAVTKTIVKHKFIPSQTQLYKLIDKLYEDRYEFAAIVIEQAIGNREHITPSAYILSGLTCLGLYKPKLLPTPSQIKALDREYHCK